MDQRVDGVDFVCTTVDVWTAHNKRFFGMTVHWIDPSTLQRCKAAISLVGHHTYDVLASKIELSYIANCSRWKSFADGQGTSNSLEDFLGSFTPVKNVLTCVQGFINRMHLQNNSE